MATCAALILAYFGGSPYEEALYLSYAEAPSGASGVSFTPLNAGQPVLNSTIGAKTIRDPFVNRDLINGGFRIVASDMPADGDAYWRGTNISTWYSKDLISFDDGHLVTVMQDKLDDPDWVTWAPEWILNPDPSGGDEFVVFWSGGGFEDTSLKNIWAATIDKDFNEASLSEPFVLLDAGYTTIDGDMVVDENGKYHLFFKDERGSNDFDTDDKAVRHVSSDSPLGPFNSEDISDLLSPTLTEGPSVFIVPSAGPGEAPYRMYYDCFMNGRYGVSESFSLDSGWASVGDSSCDGFGTSVDFPDGARHGSVVCVTDEEFQNIKEHYTR